MIILKLGGSIITKKEAKEPTIDYENLNRIAREIASSSIDKLIIVHGAGSFGHIYAKEYEIGAEIQDEEDFKQKKMGFSITQSWVKKLNTIVCDSLRENGVLTVSIQPSSFIITKNKRIHHCNLDLINKYLDMGFVPVIYGDVVPDLDESIKICVLSGDQIIKYLGENLKPERVILGSDVDGIYNKNPKKHEDAKLMKIVTSCDDLATEGSLNVDVTGGMKGKLMELIELAEIGVESEILNAGRNGLIKKALNHEKGIGTIVKKEKEV
ncbi:MAG: isopentenyl phosphate kinase family protein [Methanobacterium sp.]|uniref:isopentenyl phosphate kinase n=1 Tax=Methanobacterium sp. TaxID=2164 RepID=UPI003D64F12C|nr:isopentenyl phosphate kinase family protein [Methanobacterium sp.]